MIELKKLSKSYGNNVVLDEIDYCFSHKNTIYTVLGESGSGKTTLFNILYGIEQEYTGKYFLNGKDSSSFNSKDWDLIRNKIIGIVFQDYKLLENLSVDENLRYACFLDNDSKNKRIEEVLEIMKLNDLKKQKAGDLSGGQKQRLAIGRAIINDPDIILLDEPTGSLDDENVMNIIDYIKKIKQDKTVIIITHDNRLLNHSDVILKIEDKKLVLLKDNNDDSIVIKNNHKVLHEPELLSYFMSSLRTRVKDIILNNIPVILIICIFISIFGLINVNFNQQINNLYQGLSNKAIYISSSNFNDDYLKENNKKGISKGDDGQRINFSNDDIEKVRNIDGVAKATLYNTSTISLYDNDKDKLYLVWNNDSYPDELKELASYSSIPDVIKFTFSSMNIPYSYAKEYNKINLMCGDYPKDQSNEVVIPDILAITYKNNLKDCVGMKIKLNTYNEVGNKQEKEYQVVGVYKTEYVNTINSNYLVYTNYMENNFLNLFLSEEEYLDMKKMDLENNLSVSDYYNPIYESFESYTEAIGTNLGDMIIVLEDSDDVAMVTKELTKLFPNLKIISQYEFKYGQTAMAFQQMKQTIYIGVIGFTFILGIIIILLNKSYIKTRNKELAILYALGYSRKHTVILIVVEYLLTAIVDLAGAYLILKLVQLSGFKANEIYMLFDQVFDGLQMVQVSMFVFVMIMLSAVFSLYGINKKKLRSYLEGRK